MVECVAFGDLFAQMGNYLSNFLFSFKFIAFSSLLHLIIEHNYLHEGSGWFVLCLLFIVGHNPCFRFFTKRPWYRFELRTFGL